MTKKQIVRCIAFLLTACCTLFLLCDLFERPNNTNLDMRFTTFRKLEKNSVDAVWIGTSGVDRYWIAAKAYEEYGMVVYPLASDGLPAWLFVQQIKAAYVNQSPELIIIDSRAFAQNNSDSDLEVRARRVLDAMDFYSRNHLEAVFKTMETLHLAKPDTTEAFNLSLLLPYIKYHTKWEEEDFAISDNLGNRDHEYGGFFVHPTLSARQKKHAAKHYDESIMIDMDPICEQALYDLLDYAEEKNIELLFVDTPQKKNEEQIGRANVLYKILDERGINYINYCETNEDKTFRHIPELDRKTDFYNTGHTNFYGAEKFTANLAKYLDEHYDFPDRRNDEEVKKDWNGIYDKIKDIVQYYKENPPAVEEPEA